MSTNMPRLLDKTTMPFVPRLIHPWLWWARCHSRPYYDILIYTLPSSSLQAVQVGLPASRHLGETVESQHTDSLVKHKPRVFRLRNLPTHVDRLSVVELLCQSVEGITPQDVRISSLAHDVDVWSWLRTQTATVTFRTRPPALNSILVAGGECTVPVPGLAKPLIIDDHFYGVTPLNHVPDDAHKYE